MTLQRVIWGPVLFFLALQVGRDFFREVVVIEPLSVPKRYEERGLNPQVMSTRIADALNGIEKDVKTAMPKDRLALSSEPSPLPNFEVPGTKLDLKTVVEIARQLIGKHPKHVSGEIVFMGDSESANTDAEISLRIVQGSERGRRRKS